MKITSKGQITIPKYIRKEMGLRPSETEIEFVCDKDGRWYLKKIGPTKGQVSRFRVAHKTGQLKMSTDEILALTRG